MRIVHISDTHGLQEQLTIPECDVLCHSGDLGASETTLGEFTKFLIWFEQQPAKVKIFCAGNHDTLLDYKVVQRKRAEDTVAYLLAEQSYRDAMQLLQHYKVKYLNGKDYVWQGVKFYGSPYSPSFNRDRWAFNADRGAEICKEWGKIPNDVDVLLTHTPCYNILDYVSYRVKEGTDPHAGCADLFNVIRKRLTKLKLHCSGHIHSNWGVVQQPVTNKRNCLFSNGAVVEDANYNVILKQPVIINI